MSQASAEPIDASYRAIGRNGPGWGAVIGLTALGVVLGGGLGLGLARLFEAPIEQRLAAAEGRLDDLDKMAAGEAQRTKAVLAAETAALRADVQSLKEIASRGEGGFNAAMTPAAIFAVESVIDAARAGQPFSQPYLALAATLPDDPNVKTLAPYAELGAPTLSALKASFVEAETGVARAASSVKPGGATAAVQSMLAQFVSVRKSNIAAMTPEEAAVARAADRLKAEDLAGAADEIAKLKGPAAKAAQSWLSQAQARLAIDGATSALKVRLDRARGA